MKIISMLWYLLVVALVAQPIIFLLALMVAALMLYFEISAVIIFLVVVAMLLATPITLAVIFMMLYFKKADNLLITAQTEELSLEFYFECHVLIKDVLKLFWLNFKEMRRQGNNVFTAFEDAKIYMFEGDLRPYLAHQIRIKYGVEAQDQFNQIPDYLIDLELY